MITEVLKREELGGYELSDEALDQVTGGSFMSEAAGCCRTAVYLAREAKEAVKHVIHDAAQAVADATR